MIDTFISIPSWVIENEDSILNYPLTMPLIALHYIDCLIV